MTITALIIDSREPDWVKNLTFGGLPTTVTFLPIGDLMGACDDGTMILVERKTEDDLLNSIADNRLFNQLAEMPLQTPWSYLVITGALQRGPDNHVVTARGETKWSWSSVQGALLTAQEMGVFVVMAGGDADYENAVRRLGARDHRPDMLLAPPKLPHILSAQEQIIASLPGIGLERLQAVLSYCGTPAWALVSLTDPTTKIPGIPNGIKPKIRNALKLKDDEQFVIYTADEGDTELLKIDQLGKQ